MYNVVQVNSDDMNAGINVERERPDTNLLYLTNNP